MNKETFNIKQWPKSNSDDHFFKILKKLSGIEFLKTKIKFGSEETKFKNAIKPSSINSFTIPKGDEDTCFTSKNAPLLFISLLANWGKEDTEEDLGAKYLGTSLVFFPCYPKCEDADNNKYDILPSGVIVAMGMGTGGPGPDDELVSNPGHIRRFEGMVNTIKDKIKKEESLLWFREEPLKQKPVPQKFIKDVEILFGAKNLALQWREDSKGGYGQYLYAIAALKFNDDGELSGNQKEILKGFIKFYARERGLTKNTDKDFAKDWYKRLFDNPNTDLIYQKLEKHKYLILSGPPGTKKTDIINEIATNKFVNRHIIIQFHPNTTYQSFVGGIQPILDSSNNNKELKFEFKIGALIKGIENAKGLENDEKYLLVIDEINRADLATVLGEAVNLFEPTKKYTIEIPNYGKVEMPDNLYVLCAMNTADRNISSIDVAIRRRFAFVYIWPTKPEGNNTCDLGKQSFNELNDIFMEYGDKNDILLMPGGFYFLGNEENVRENIKTRLLPLLEDYLNENRISNTLQKEIELFIQKTKLAL